MKPANKWAADLLDEDSLEGYLVLIRKIQADAMREAAKIATPRYRGLCKTHMGKDGTVGDALLCRCLDAENLIRRRANKIEGSGKK